MMRQANAATRSLLRLQAARRTIEADPQAYDRGERIEHHMTVLMTGAITDRPPVSPDDPESRTTETEILPRHPAPTPALGIASQAQPGVATQASCTPPPVSPYNPESHIPETETRPRQPATRPTLVTASPPRQRTPVHATRTRLPVLLHDPESHATETEILPRLPAPTPTRVTASPAQPGVAAQATRTPSPVSPHDPESRATETETCPRQPAAPSTHVTASPPRQGTPAHATRARPPVSPHDPESRTAQTENSAETPRPSTNTTMAPGPPRLRLPPVRPPHRGRCVNSLPLNRSPGPSIRLAEILALENGDWRCRDRLRSLRRVSQRIHLGLARHDRNDQPASANIRFRA